MRQKILTTLTIACVLASAAIFALLARSYSTCDDVHYTFGSSDRAVFRTFDLGSLEGHLFLSIITFNDEGPGRETGFDYSVDYSQGRFSSRPLATMDQFYNDKKIWLKFGIVSASNAGGTEAIRGVAMPHWFAAIALLVLPIIRSVKWFRHRRQVRAGCCAKCGYDLRASSGRCPECGASTSEGQPAAA
jgi:hypothetical protein